MDVSVIRSARFPVWRKNHVVIRKSSLLGCGRELVFARRKSSQVGIGHAVDWRRWRRSVLPVLAAAGVERAVVGKEAGGRSQDRKNGQIPLYVALPLDTISNDNTLNHAKAISTGLKALKLLGITGVSVPVWWGIVENEAAGKYNWSAYQSLLDIIRAAGLKIRVSLCFHGTTAIALPPWVIKIGESDPDIFFRDRAGKRYKNCLSWAVDSLPVLAGRSPMQAFEEFLSEFKHSFSSFLGTAITDVSVGLGPDGELRYPAFPESLRGKIQGVGEFQCYDKYMLANLKQHAENSGHVDWGYSGPHDAPTYNQWPQTNNFFKDAGGSWETSYGDFFLTWYSDQLIGHGDRLLSLASRVLSDSQVSVSGKVPLVHSWYKTRSHAAELTAGFYNTDKRNGYEAVAKMFAANSASLVLPGMDLSDAHQPIEARSSPQSLMSQIRAACARHNVPVLGENRVINGVSDNFSRMTENLREEDEQRLESFTYNRMGAQFFSPDHFPKFTQFFRELAFPQRDVDDLPDNKATVSLSGAMEPEKTLAVQA